jgi:photosystem II stability/assembly factor-like uncharacterized protein
LRVYLATSLGLILFNAPLNVAAGPQSGQWEVISDGILTELGKTHPESADPYAVKTAGISVDRTNGDVYLLANNIGICKSTDQGRTFKLVSGSTVTGRFETSGGLNVDPRGHRLMCFSIYGSCGYSPDAGKSWIQSKIGHLDYGAVDWSDTGKALLSVGHESGGKLLYSTDSGATWTTLGMRYWAVGLFDRKTLLCSIENMPGILRSTDGGQTWAKVSEEKLAAPVMTVFKGVGYWLCENGLLVSKDKGTTWNLIGPTPKGATLGPLFGTNDRHVVIGAQDGLFESKDGGKSWSMAAPRAPEIKVLRGGKYGTYGWDPIHNIFYASQMAKPAYRFIVGKH